VTYPGTSLYPGLGTFPGSSGDTARINPVLLTVDGLDFGVDDGTVGVVFDTLTGWYSGPGSRSNFTDRPSAHGSFDGPVYRTARVVTASGWAYANSRAAVMAALHKMTGVLAEGQSGEVVVDDPDYGKLSITARLTDGPLIAPFNEVHWTWQFQLTAPDPHKYGATVSAVTALASAGATGLAFPLYGGTGKREYGSAGASGQATVSNPGTADATLLFTVTGPLYGGFAITDTATGNRVVYAGDVPAGAVLIIDCATGRARLNGADRALQVAQWWTVKAGSSSTVAFAALGVPVQSGFLTVSIRPAYW
jgi:hypothetical protein